MGISGLVWDHQKKRGTGSRTESFMLSTIAQVPSSLFHEARPVIPMLEMARIADGLGADGLRSPVGTNPGWSKK